MLVATYFVCDLCFVGLLFVQGEIFFDAPLVYLLGGDQLVEKIDVNVRSLDALALRTGIFAIKLGVCLLFLYLYARTKKSEPYLILCVTFGLWLIGPIVGMFFIRLLMTGMME